MISVEDLILIFAYLAQQHFATILEHIVWSPLNTWIFWSPVLDPHLTTHHSNVGHHLG